MEFVDLKTQFARHRAFISDAISRVLSHRHYILGPEVTELEEALAARIGAAFCVSVANGTDALQIALMVAGVGPGDEVITTPFTFVSSAEVIRLLGARPVFADIDPQTFNLSPEAVAPLITPKTKAIIAVSLFGQMADLVSLNQMVEGKGITLIEDGAQSFGATQQGRFCGNSSLVGTTSFYPTKTLGCYGDGGALFTNSADLAEAMREIRNHGGAQRDHYTRIGMNSRLDTLQAAILLAKLAFFDEELEKRTYWGERYTAFLQEWCQTPFVAEGNKHVYGNYTIRSPDRDRLVTRLKEMHIPTMCYYPCPLHLQPAFLDLGYSPGDFPEAERASREALSLPLHPYLPEDAAEKITQVFADEHSFAR